jgi:carbamate kinase
MLTHVGAVMEHFGTAAATPPAQLSLDDLSAMRFPAGSMAPKIESCRRFVNATDRAGIGALSEPSALFAGTASTTIRSHTNKHNAQHSPV